MPDLPKDLLHRLSTNELHKEIEKLVSDDVRSLPRKPKVFAAIAKLQKFDLLPQSVTHGELDKLVEDGCIEIQRGISPTKGIQASLYAQELREGPMYPGTLSAMGNGVYFAVPSLKIAPIGGFKMLSRVALKYTKGDGYGVIVRAVLKKEAQCIEKDQLTEVMRDFKGRAKSAGITDMGALAAALGFDAFYCDGVYDDTHERVWVVLNRAALVLQTADLKIRH